MGRELPQLRASGLEETEGFRQNIARLHLLHGKSHGNRTSEPWLFPYTSYAIFPFWAAGPWAEAIWGLLSLLGIMSPSESLLPNIPPHISHHGLSMC